tara:strand:- start:46 stop:543 length:498 start_codon:yes stop_codon:yes gene_type:complete
MYNILRMIKNILGCDFKYENDKMYRLNNWTKKWNCCNDNKPNTFKYIQIGCNRKLYYLHRLIYKYHNQDWDITDTSSDNQIDHININSLDNRIENLRVVNNSQNNRNKNKRDNCSSIYKGVSKKNKKWKATITIDGKLKHLGYYETEEEAYLAYQKKYEELMNLS